MILKKGKQAIVAMCLLLAVFFSGTSHCALTLEPYIGVDQQLNRMKFNKGQGHDLFPKHHMQFNAYTGLKINQAFSAELGYVSTVAREKYCTVYVNEDLFGRPLPEVLSPVKFVNYVKTRGYHLSLVHTYAPIEWDHVRIRSGMGVSFLKALAQINPICMGTKPVFTGNVRQFRKQKTVMRVMISPEYKFKNNLGIRSSVCFIQTSKIIITAQPKQGLAVNPVIRLKDSLIYSLGMFYEF
jgi:hypothetical protein